MLGGVRTYLDPDDITTPGDFYYLITGLNECGNESGTGQAWDRYQYFDRPAPPRHARLPLRGAVRGRIR